MIITVGGIKGGSGKTTVATHLAVLRGQAGGDVLLVDADDQETSSDFTVLRSSNRAEGAGYTSIKLTGAAVRTETLKLKDKYADIIIDTGGRDTTSQRAAISISDILLIPFVPRSFDIWTIEKAAEIVAEMKAANPTLQAYTFINRADSRGSDNDEAATVLNENEVLKFSGLTIGNRKAFGNAAANGFSVTEVRPSDPKAVEEIMALYKMVFQ